MKPEDFLKRSQAYLKNLQDLSTKAVKVGLPKEKSSSRVYGDGTTVLEVGAAHEYGAGVPVRSFLRTPFAIKRKEINKVIDRQFVKLLDGETSADTALGLVGVTALNISRGAFTTKGYGTWMDISEETKEAKGSSQILIDSGILRASLTWSIE